MKNINLKNFIVIGAVLSATLVSCDNEDRIKETIYKAEISVKGDKEGFDGSFYITGSNMYDERMNILETPYKLSPEDQKKDVNIFYSKYYSEKITPFTCDGIAYKFTENDTPQDTLQLKIKAYRNNTLIIDTLHNFLSYTKDEAETLQDSIDKQNNFTLKIPSLN